jgi:hypothetical protein
VTTRVLYVEHDDDNLYMLKTRLERCADFEVVATEDSEQGGKLAVTEHPDVILMDLEMPVAAGKPYGPSRKTREPETSRSSACPRMPRPASVRRPWPRGAMSSMPNRSNLRVYSRPFGTCLQSPNRCSAEVIGDFVPLHESGYGTLADMPSTARARPL